jgi:predicted O-methyltransferase YrrM
MTTEFDIADRNLVYKRNDLLAKIQRLLGQGLGSRPRTMEMMLLYGKACEAVGAAMGRLDVPKSLGPDDVPGYATEDLKQIYREAVERAPADRPSTFVEVGAALGKSTSYMAQLIAESGKPIRFYACDLFNWPFKGRMEFAVEAGGSEAILTLVENLRDVPMFVVVERILRKLELRQHVTLSAMSGQDLAQKMPDHSLDFVYIDASHEEDDTRSNLTAFLPKMRRGGIVAGHDLDHPGYPGVRQAVESVFGTDFRKVGRSFVHVVG